MPVRLRRGCTPPQGVSRYCLARSAATAAVFSWEVAEPVATAEIRPAFDCVCLSVTHLGALWAANCRGLRGD